MRKAIKNLLEDVQIGQQIKYKNMIVLPVISKESASQRFLTIDKALDENLVHITEISDLGDVPKLKLKNLSDDKVFILDGEELIGAKQNRVTNSVVLAPENHQLIIPVSCVERSRWNYRSKRFTSGNTRVYSKLRKKIFLSTLNNKHRQLKHHPQHEVWNDIDSKMARMSVDSTTNAMNDIYKQYLKRLKKFHKEFTKRKDQVGMIVIINNKVVCCEMFSNHDMMDDLYEKILYSYAIDAIEDYDGRIRTLKTIRRKALNFLNEIRESHFYDSESVGSGNDLMFSSDNVSGAALQYNDEVIYMSAFPKTTH